MLALTLQSPWPFAFTDLGKRIENRPWAPSPDRLAVGGTFALHGGKTPTPAVQEVRRNDFVHELLRCPSEVYVYYLDHFREIQGIFALAQFGGIVTQSKSPWFVGPKGWVIPKLLVLRKPVPCPGKQGLWDVPPKVRRLVDEQVGDFHWDLVPALPGPAQEKTPTHSFASGL